MEEYAGRSPGKVKKTNAIYHSKIIGSENHLHLDKTSWPSHMELGEKSDEELKSLRLKEIRWREFYGLVNAIEFVMSDG